MELLQARPYSWGNDVPWRGRRRKYRNVVVSSVAAANLSNRSRRARPEDGLCPAPLNGLIHSNRVLPSAYSAEP